MRTKKIGLDFLQKKQSRGLVVGFVVFLLVSLLQILGLFRPLEWKSWDLRLALFSKPSRASQNIAIILIDQYSLDFYEENQGFSWPWPRQMYSALLSFLQEGKAKTCVFDMLFSESSLYGVEDDLAFAQSIKKFGNVFLSAFLSKEEGSQDKIHPSLLLTQVKYLEGTNQEKIVPMKSGTLPVGEVLDSTRAVGNVNFSPDKDGIFRRIPLLFSSQGLIIPALALSIAEISEEADFRIDHKGRFRVRDKRIPLDESGQMIIRYHGPQGTYKSYSAAAIINSWAMLEKGNSPQISPGDFTDKIVFIGTSAPGLYDLRPTPLSSVYPGVEIQVTALDNLLNRDFITLIPQGLFFLFVLFLAVLTGAGISILQQPSKIIIFFLFCLILPAVASSVAFLSGLWLEFVPSSSAVLLSFIGASILNYVFEGRQKRFLKNVFRFYLNSHVIEQIIENPDLLRLGGQKREVSSFFSDIAGFTALSEQMSPERLVDLLNAYLSEMTDIILSFQGTLDKYEGDAIISFWNAPLDQPDHAVRACRAALKCQAQLVNLQPEFKLKYGIELAVRIGVNSGPAVVGNMGSRDRFDYTAIGDTINLASRLEGACKLYKVPILIGEETYNEAHEQIIGRQVDVIRVVGKKRPEQVYEIIGEKGQVEDSVLEKISLFHSALELYRKRDWDNADQLFQKLENDMLAQVYRERVSLFKLSPPPEQWDGVFDLKTK